MVMRVRFVLLNAHPSIIFTVEGMEMLVRAVFSKALPAIVVTV